MTTDFCQNKENCHRVKVTSNQIKGITRAGRGGAVLPAKESGIAVKKAMKNLSIHLAYCPSSVSSLAKIFRFSTTHFHGHA